MNSLRATLIGILVGIGVVFLIYLMGMYGKLFLVELINIMFSIFGPTNVIVLVIIIVGAVIGGIIGREIYISEGNGWGK